MPLPPELLSGGCPVWCGAACPPDVHICCNNSLLRLKNCSPDGLVRCTEMFRIGIYAKVAIYSCDRFYACFVSIGHGAEITYLHQNTTRDESASAKSNAQAPFAISPSSRSWSLPTSQKSPTNMWHHAVHDRNTPPGKGHVHMIRGTPFRFVSCLRVVAGVGRQKFSCAKASRLSRSNRAFSTPPKRKKGCQHPYSALDKPHDLQRPTYRSDARAAPGRRRRVLPRAHRQPEARAVGSRVAEQRPAVSAA